MVRKVQHYSKPSQNLFRVVKRDVVIGETITVAELANKMATKATGNHQSYDEDGRNGNH